MRPLIAQLFLIVYVCVKCGLINHHVGNCEDCHGQTHKEVLDDAYLEEFDDPPSC